MPGEIRARQSRSGGSIKILDPSNGTITNVDGEKKQKKNRKM